MAVNMSRLPLDMTPAPSTPSRAPRVYSGGDETHSQFIRTVLTTDHATDKKTHVVSQVVHFDADKEHDELPDEFAALNVDDAVFHQSEEHTIRVSA